MKTFFKIIFILFILFAGFIGFVMFFTSPVSSVASDFFSFIKQNNYYAAMGCLSAEYRQTIPLEKLKQDFPYERFKHYSGCFFNNREVNESGLGRLEGKIKFDDGSQVKVEINLIKENGSWKIEHINFPQGGFGSNKIAENNNNNGFADNLVSTESESSANGVKLNEEQLVHSTMVSLVNAILSNDFTKFYNSTSTPFKNSVSLQQTANAFKDFRNVQINWHDVKDMKPIITKKEKEEHGVMKYEGYYPTAPRHLHFNFEFYPENGKYKIFGAFLKVK